MRVAAVLVLYKVGGCGVLLVERLVRTSAKFSAAGAAACMLNLARLHDDATDDDALRYERIIIIWYKYFGILVPYCWTYI